MHLYTMLRKDRRLIMWLKKKKKKTQKNVACLEQVTNVSHTSHGVICEAWLGFHFSLQGVWKGC